MKKAFYSGLLILLLAANVSGEQRAKRPIRVVGPVYERSTSAVPWSFWFWQCMRIV